MPVFRTIGVSSDIPIPRLNTGNRKLFLPFSGNQHPIEFLENWVISLTGPSKLAARHPNFFEIKYFNDLVKNIRPFKIEVVGAFILRASHDVKIPSNDIW